jgi:hypothetical protein
MACSRVDCTFFLLLTKKFDIVVSKTEISGFQGHFQCIPGLWPQVTQNASTERSMPSNMVFMREDNVSSAASRLSAKCFLVQRVCVVFAENWAIVNFIKTITLC